MKRTFIFLLGVMMVVPSMAGPDDVNEVCKRNTLVMVVLENKTNGQTVNYNTDTMRWDVDFGYDLFASAHPDYVVRTNIVGRTTCNEISVKSSDDGTKSNNGDAEPGDANTFLKAAPGDVGPNCWCKMDGPVTSWWTFVKQYDSVNECDLGCTEYCAKGFSGNLPMDNNLPLREALFNKIW